MGSFILSDHDQDDQGDNFYIQLEKIAAIRAAFSSSCGGLQPSAATVRPFGPKNRALC